MPANSLRPACALLLALALGCTSSVNPATGRREVVLMTAEDEQRIDVEATQEIEASVGLAADPSLNRYVESVGKALAAHSPRQDVHYTFQIVEMDEPNAFALPGGHIYVSRGLLLLANSEAEIAHVLGHEIGHVAARHAAKLDAHMKTLGIATLLGDLLSGGAEETAPSETAGSNPFARYARDQERQADSIGQQIATQSGVDPAGMARFLTALDNYTKLNQGFSMPQTYFSSHPAASERMIETAARAQEHKWRNDRSPLREWAPGRPVATSRGAYLAHLDGLTIGRPAAEGMFDGSRFLHAEMNFSQQFPTGWQLLNLSDQVVAISPKRDAVALLQLDSRGDDPAAAAHAYAKREGFALGSEISLQLGGLPAYRARAFLPTSFGRLPAEITWIAYQGMIYRLIAGVQPGTLRSYEGVLRKFSHGFRPLTPEERARITELRLRIAEVRPGESLAELSARTQNQWDLAFTAVANGLAPAAPIAPGSLIKVAVREPYVPAPQTPTPAPARDDAAPGDTAK
jgi:predicted Zn-dependent protease